MCQKSLVKSALLNTLTTEECVLSVPFQPAFERPGGIVSGQVFMAAADVARGALAQLGRTAVWYAVGQAAADALAALNPRLLYVSASGLGRTGPEARAVAYGTILQCYAGFAGLNRHPGVAPRVGLAWLDPMCGLMIAFGVAAALWHRRRTSEAARIDFSMLEAMLWTMAEPLLAAQTGAPPEPRGNATDRDAPHGAYRCAGDDEWVSLAVTSDGEWRSVPAEQADPAETATPSRSSAMT
jgi:crotonobetainyl-CoA:carnitine CoA-transferase CaiB-like acyl-CoA transferase